MGWEPRDQFSYGCLPLVVYVVSGLAFAYFVIDKHFPGLLPDLF